MGDRPYATGWCPFRACTLNGARQRCYDPAMLCGACRYPLDYVLGPDAWPQLPQQEPQWILESTRGAAQQHVSQQLTTGAGEE
eukprot:8892110-Lingulodinium_polyedra.AAC.1